MSILNDKNILIVDDDKDLTNLYETFLKFYGYKICAEMCRKCAQECRNMMR